VQIITFICLSVLSARCSQSLAPSVWYGSVSVLNLDNHGKTNTFHFPSDVSYAQLMIVRRSEHEISSLNKGAALFCAGEASVGSDLSWFRHNMCSRQILSLHKLMS